jgi:hypothetical protein
MGVEWVGGLFSTPGYAMGEGEPYRPEGLCWMGADGKVLGWAIGKPGELLDTAGKSLQSAIERPMVGRAHAPARVRVASPDLADVLRTAHPSIDIVCAPTPEIDAMVELMRQKLGQDAEAPETYFTPEVDADAVASLFRAAAALFRAKPWKVVPDDRCLFSVTIDKLDVRNAVMCVIGQLGESRALVLFTSLDDFEAFLDAAGAIERGEKPAMPGHFSLNFERGADLAPALRKEIAQHHWEVAGPEAYPWLMIVDEDLVPRPPTADEVTITEAIALALPEVLLAKKALRAAWKGGAPFTRTISVATHAGDLEVTLSAPAEHSRGEHEGDLLGDLADLAEAGEEMDGKRRERLENELLGRFVASPEAKGLTDVQACRWVMDFAANYLGATIATLDPAELREILFEIVPRKVSIDASEARWIIEDNRALYAFLKREFGLEQADGCLRVLADDAVKKLEAALSDPRNFGMAKSLMMAGRDAGFDMSSKEGIEAWMREVQSKPLPDSVRIPSLDELPFGRTPPGRPSRPADGAAARARKNRRKAERKARKKNR